MTKKVAILQSNYMPWKGYFDIINMVDEFVFYDDVQYTKNDWRNRNLIKTVNGGDWLTIPCGSDLKRLVCEVKLNDNRWQRKHLSAIKTWYGKAPGFNIMAEFLNDVYVNQSWETLSELNHYFIKRISTEFLNINTKFNDSRKYSLSGGSTQKLIDLLVELKATHYLSGAAAKEYLNLELFEDANIKIEWMDYSGYKEYPQLYGDFIHELSIIDLIMNTGSEANKYLKSVSYGE